MTMKSQEKKKRESVCLCAQMFQMFMPAFSPKQLLEAIIDIKKKKSLQELFFYFSLCAFSLIISKSRNSQNPNTQLTECHSSVSEVMAKALNLREKRKQLQGFFQGNLSKCHSLWKMLNHCLKSHPYTS